MVKFRSSKLGPSRLRTKRVAPAEPDIVDGRIELPSKPGLGITLNEKIAERFRR